MKRLVVKRKKGQSVRIGQSVVTIGEASRSEVKLVIEAPEDVVVLRKEIDVEVEYRRPEPGKGEAP